MLRGLAFIIAVIICICAVVLYDHHRGSNLEITLALIKPNAFDQRSLIENVIMQNGFRIIHSKEFHFTELDAKEFYQEHSHRSFYLDLVKFMCSGSVFAMQLEKSNAIRAWRDLMGPTNPEKARISNPNSIRALYGKNVQNNAVHGSDSKQSANREIQLVFP